MSYGTVTVEDSGRQITGNNDSKYEEIQIDYKFQVYDPGGTIDAVAREKRVVCNQNPKKMLHIKVKSDGYYRFRIYSDDKKDLTGSKLTMYDNAPKRL